ncbi:BTAD domain-containing putative transcriptional regulator [Amycolatopsis sp. cmx-4-68]|uniref:AfsR/SARP family transcriptional regulator n=1 Tax=Amycolatopsis sp. cmx-4-68 TaxID=2790938 RepID=UPI00397D0081
MLCLLGEVTVRVGGEPVDLGPARQRCALAALAVEAGRVVAADRLVERVWGAQPPRRGRATLYSYLSRLRQALGGAGDIAIERRSGGYLLTTTTGAPAAVDLHRFRELCAAARTATDAEEAARTLTEALALWRGDALAGLDGEWAEAERERLGQERLAAQRDLADARLALGHGDRLVAELAAQAGAHPLDERVAGQYLTALHQAGRTADALAHYRLVRTRLAEELGTDPGAALQQVHRRLLAAPATSLPLGQPPRQLPAAPRPFVGRRADLARLDAALEAGGTVVVSAIAGAGGIGKTWLALHWAHRHADRFPDGQLFVDLRGFSPDSAPMDPAAAMRGLLDALGVEPDRIPLDPHARAALFRGLVAGKRLLLVLDNAADTGQVAPLLPGSDTCTVLVTSRVRLTGLITAHAARHLALDVLSGAEARALLTDRLGAARTRAEDAAVQRLVALCGGFPLALSIVAAHAHIRAHRSLAALADELRDHGLGALADDDPTASLPAVLSWSHQALTPAQATAFALLGVAPGPDIGLAAAAALVGEPPPETRRLLLGLEQASLLAQDARGRYRMHDLIRRYAADTAGGLPAGSVAAAQRRVADFYRHTALGADRLVNPHRAPITLPPPVPGVTPEALPDDQAAMAWFDAEHRCLLAALDVAGAGAWDLAWALETYHRRRGHLRDRLAAWRSGLAAAGPRLGPADHILTHRLLGRAHADLGRHEEAIGHLHQALALAGQHGDAVNEAHTHRTLAAAWVTGGEPRKAYEHAVQALRICRTLDDPVWEAGALNAVGWYAAQLGEHDTARENCVAALELFRRHDAAEGQATTLDSLGYIAHRTGRHAEAVEHYRAALTLLRDIGSWYEEAGTLDRIGHAYAALEQHRQARAVWEEALELYRRQGRDEEARQIRRQLDALPSTED